MNSFDLTIENGTVANSGDTFQADIGIRDGRIAALGKQLGAAKKTLDASGKLMLPGAAAGRCATGRPETRFSAAFRTARFASIRPITRRTELTILASSLPVSARRFRKSLTVCPASRRV
ncbi:MAG: hypothetical protein AAF417_15910 [Pseudomonadota bacterium]